MGAVDLLRSGGANRSCSHDLCHFLFLREEKSRTDRLHHQTYTQDQSRPRSVLDASGTFAQDPAEHQVHQCAQEPEQYEREPNSDDRRECRDLQ